MLVLLRLGASKNDEAAFHDESWIARPTTNLALFSCRFPTLGCYSFCILAVEKGLFLVLFDGYVDKRRNLC